jgi:hypothetical protein
VSRSTYQSACHGVQHQSLKTEVRNSPMAAFDIMIISSRSYSIHNICSDRSDGREAASCRRSHDAGPKGQIRVDGVKSSGRRPNEARRQSNEELFSNSYQWNEYIWRSGENVTEVVERALVGSRSGLKGHCVRCQLSQGAEARSSRKSLHKFGIAKTASNVHVHLL